MMRIHLRQAVATALFAFGACALPQAALAQAGTYVVKFGSPTINDTVHHWMRLFKEGVEKRSQGRMRVELYPASQLGPIPRQIEAVQFGTQEMFSAPPEFLAGVDKRYMVVSAPLLFKDIEHGFRTVQDPAFSKTVFDLGLNKGIRGISMFCADPTSYTSTKPIKSIQDFSGRKIRIFASDMERETMRRLNATGVPMSLGEVLPALQQGVVDGARTTVSIFTAFKFHGSAKYLVKTEEAMVCPLQFVSRQWFDSLPKDLQTIVLEEARAADTATHKFAVSFLAENYKRWTDSGGEIAELSASERAELVRRLQDVGATVTKSDPALQQTYTQLKSIADRIRH